MLQYQHLTEDELLHVADESEQLTDEARLALESELRRRNLSTSEVKAYNRQCADDNEADKLRRARRQVIPNLGLGEKFLGKTNCRRDPSDLFELYESTLWFVVLWFPVYPFATYTVRRDLERWWLGMAFTSNEITGSPSTELGDDPFDVGKSLCVRIGASSYVPSRAALS
jgi:hypothetical protein